MSETANEFLSDRQQFRLRCLELVTERTSTMSLHWEEVMRRAKEFEKFVLRAEQDDLDRLGGE